MVIDQNNPALEPVRPPETKKAMSLVLDLGCKTALYRVIGCSYSELVERAREVAASAAGEGLPLHSPVTELFEKQRGRYDVEGTTLGWHYERAYKAASSAVDPLAYFSITSKHAFVFIKSLGINGAGGELRVDRRHLREVFRRSESATPSSYESWAHDPHPSGGVVRLLRMDDSESPDDYGRLRLVLDDIHPCRGHIDFGEAQQELDQVAAFVKLRELVLALFAANEPTEAQREAAAARASAISSRVTVSFLPSSGYCYRCEGDVTHSFASAGPKDSITGCPLCGRSWCD